MLSEKSEAMGVGKEGVVVAVGSGVSQVAPVGVVEDKNNDCVDVGVGEIAGVLCGLGEGVEGEMLATSTSNDVTQWWKIERLF